MASTTFSLLFMINWVPQDATPTLNFASFLLVLASAIALATLQIAHKN
ncbi:MAG: hypothetical protein KME12_16775 [Trichocoleus desertorum ATA4-8-CV12]|jgi:hypothetical protein|nr:hypothetical protein [Trichocoleus desertorum ATA4-8-CV12]